MFTGSCLLLPITTNFVTIIYKLQPAKVACRIDCVPPPQNGRFWFHGNLKMMYTSLRWRLKSNLWSKKAVLFCIKVVPHIVGQITKKVKNAYISKTPHKLCALKSSEVTHLLYVRNRPKLKPITHYLLKIIPSSAGSWFCFVCFDSVSLSLLLWFPCLFPR